MLGEPLPAPEGLLTHLFPAPAAIAEADLALLSGPGRRRETLRSLARLLDRGEVAIDPGSDRAEVAARLLEIPGVGPWTEQYIAMRGLCDPDAFLPSDLGVRRALEALAGGGEGDGRGARARPPALYSPREVARLAESWRPWRAYALQHIWASLAQAGPGPASSA